MQYLKLKINYINKSSLVKENWEIFVSNRRRVSKLKNFYLESEIIWNV